MIHLQDKSHIHVCVIVLKSQNTKTTITVNSKSHLFSNVLGFLFDMVLVLHGIHII